MSGAQSQKTLILAFLVLWGMVTNDTATAQTIRLDGFDVTFNGSNYDPGKDQTTFTYTVAGTPDARNALSHFTIGINSGCVVIGSSPSQSVSVGPDPPTGVWGIKWDIGLEKGKRRTYSFALRGRFSEGPVNVAVKAGRDGEVGTITGPSGPAPNDPPTISGIFDQTVFEDHPARVSFTVNDKESAPGDLVVQAISSATSLLNPERFEISGTGKERTVTCYPAADRNGGGLITLLVSDGETSTKTK
ncbi:MAG: hypothetical protein ABIH23_07070, partial [bacterium]